MHFVLIVEAFYNYVMLQSSTKNNAIIALNVLFNQGISKFGIPNFLVKDNGNEYVNLKIALFCHRYNVQFKSRTPYFP